MKRLAKREAQSRERGPRGNQRTGGAGGVVVVDVGVSGTVVDTGVFGGSTPGGFGMLTAGGSGRPGGFGGSITVELRVPVDEHPAASTPMTVASASTRALAE